MLPVFKTILCCGSFFFFGILRSQTIGVDCDSLTFDYRPDKKFNRFINRGKYFLIKDDLKSADKFLSKAKFRVNSSLGFGVVNIPSLYSLYGFNRGTGNKEELLFYGKLLVCSKSADFQVLADCINISLDLNDNINAIYFLKKSEELFGLNYQTALAIRNVFLKLNFKDSSLTYVYDYILKSGDVINGSLLYVNTLNRIGQNYEAYIFLKRLVRLFPDALPVKIAFIDASHAFGKDGIADFYFKQLVMNSDIKIDIKSTLIVNAMNRLRESKVLDSGWEMVSKWAQWNIQSNPNEARPYVIAAAIFLKTEQKEKFELYCKHAIENGMKEDQLSREINTLMQW